MYWRIGERIVKQEQRGGGGLRRADCGTAHPKSVGKIWPRVFSCHRCFKCASFTLPTELESRHRLDF